MYPTKGITARTLIAAASLATLCACASAPKQMNTTPSGVSYTYSDGSDLAKVNEKAMKFCSGHGKTAKLENVGKNDGQPVAMFDCV